MISTEFKEFLSHKTNKIYLIILAILCFVLPNVYLYKEVNMVNINFIFVSAIFVAIGSFAIISREQKRNINPYIFVAIGSFAIARIFKWQNALIQALAGIFIGCLFYYGWINLAVNFSNHLELTNGKVTNYYYKGGLFHIDNNEAGSVWYNSDDENYEVTFIYENNKKIKYINGEKQ